MTVSVGGMEISAASLAAIVRNADAKTLIIDCRCLAEFKQSHVRRALNPFYSKLLQRRLLEDKTMMDYRSHVIEPNQNKLPVSELWRIFSLERLLIKLIASSSISVVILGIERLLITSIF
ncbi:unnamed protein product [Angiostrongylus costaricensis]|uniref:Rhodanese domain-containing protein n=1 Tax=Angiostrongylus costaricensis TaxID=334426 RepID=A0A0R3PHY6_ANGCS|nr:unnamed protein product [Angiostrongylus costaricensis]